MKDTIVVTSSSDVTSSVNAVWVSGIGSKLVFGSTPSVSIGSEVVDIVVVVAVVVDVDVVVVVVMFVSSIFVG